MAMRIEPTNKLLALTSYDPKIKFQWNSRRAARLLVVVVDANLMRSVNVVGIPAKSAVKRPVS